MSEKNNTEILLAQWQTCVEMANSISQRRDSMNNVFVTINLAITTAISFSFSTSSILALIAGIVVCIIWILFIRNYKLLNTEKFLIINEIENHLPTKPFNNEWERLKGNKKYKDTTNLERTLAFAFIVLYIIAAIYIVVTTLCEKG